MFGKRVGMDLDLVNTGKAKKGCVEVLKSGVAVSQKLVARHLVQKMKQHSHHFFQSRCRGFAPIVISPK